MKRSKLPPEIRKLPDGRYRLDVTDSNDKRHRPICATLDEAKRRLALIEGQKSSGEFFATSSNTDLNYALDLLLKRPKKLALASKLRVESIVEGHIRPALGSRKLSDFSGERMKFVKDFLEQKAQDYAHGSMAHMHSAIKLALDLVIDAGVMGAPNPMTTFKVGVPDGTGHRDRDALTLDEITSLFRRSKQRDKWERELVFAMRGVLATLGLFTGFRNQECSGLFWDCVDFDGRMIYMRRIWREGEGIVETSKTGASGFRDIHMSPVLHAVLGAWGDWLRAQGRTLQGPVLCTERADIILPDAISADHWPTLADKAGFVDSGALRHTFYALRHTAGNLWRSVGFDLSYVKDYMGHTDIGTTSKHYLHRTPGFAVLRREVEDLGLSSTPEGLVDALAIVLARRLREKGIDVPCSPPAEHSVPARLRLDHSEQRLLPGNVITLEPDSVAVDAPPAINGIPSLQALRDWQRGEAKRLAGLGWKHARIARHLGIDQTTVSNMVRGSDDQMWLRKLGHAARAELRAEARRMRIEEDATNAEIGLALKVSPHRVFKWLQGLPMKNWRRASQKYGKHEALIRRRITEGKSLSAIAREIGVPRVTGIAQFAERLGIWPRKSTMARADCP